MPHWYKSKKRLKVLESAEFINSKHSLRLHDFRVLYLFLSQRDQRVAIDSEELYFIDNKQYAEMYGLTTGAAHAELKGVKDRVDEQRIELGGEVFKLMSYEGLRMVDGGMEMRWDRRIIPHICDFKGSYSTKYLEDIRGMRTIYGLRLYRLLTQYSIAKFRRFKVTELRELLGVGGKYERFASFRKSVVEVAVRDIFGATGKGVRMEEIKRGRKVWEVRFGCLRVG